MSTQSEPFRDDAGDAGQEDGDQSQYAQGGSSGQVDPAEGADVDEDLDTEPAAAAEGGDPDLLTEGGQSQVDPAEGTDDDW